MFNLEELLKIRAKTLTLGYPEKRIYSPLCIGVETKSQSDISKPKTVCMERYKVGDDDGKWDAFIVIWPKVLGMIGAFLASISQKKQNDWKGAKKDFPIK